MLIMVLRVLDILTLRFENLQQQSDTIRKFIGAIKKWKIESCPCRLCRVYLQIIGDIDLSIKLLFSQHKFYKIVDIGLLQTCEAKTFYNFSKLLSAIWLLLQKQPTQKIQGILNLHLIRSDVCISCLKRINQYYGQEP